MGQTKTKKEVHAQDLVKATRAARNSLFILAAMTLIKAFGGYVTNIVSLTADAVGSFSDVIASSAVFIGLKFSQKKATENFKYGYHRIETFLALCISVIITYAGYKIAGQSFERFFVHVKTGEHAIGIITAVIAICLSLFSFLYQLIYATLIHSAAMRASAYDKRNDAVVSFGVLVSIIADKFSLPYVEAVVGLLIAVLVLWTGLNQAKDALFYLLDYWDEPEVTEKIRAVLTQSKIVTGVKNIRLRHLGTYIYGEAFLEVNPFTESKDLRDELNRLNAKIANNISHVGDLVIYINPPKPTLVHVAIPIHENNGLLSTIAENRDESFSFFFTEILNNKIVKSYAVEDSFTVDQPTEIAAFLKTRGANIVISSLMSPLLYYNLRLNNIKVYPHLLDVKDVGNTVKLLLLDI